MASVHYSSYGAAVRVLSAAALLACGHGLTLPSAPCGAAVTAFLGTDDSSSACIGAANASMAAVPAFDACAGARTNCASPYAPQMAGLVPSAASAATCPLCPVLASCRASFERLLTALDTGTAASGGAGTATAASQAVRTACSSPADRFAVTQLVLQSEITCAAGAVKSIGGGSDPYNRSGIDAVIPQAFGINGSVYPGWADMSSAVFQCSTCAVIPCVPGLYCPANQVPIFCPPGYYCPTPMQQIICPDGYFCPERSTAPQPCRAVSAGSCVGEGNRREVVWVPLLVAVVLLALVLLHTSGRLRSMLSFCRPRPSSSTASDKANVKQHASGRSPASPSRRGGAEGSAIIPPLAAAAAAAAAGAGSKNAVADRPSVAASSGLRIDFNELRLVSNGNTRLDGVTGSIMPGRLTGVIGGSGAGKTTLVSVLLGREKATSGSVSYSLTGASNVGGSGGGAGGHGTIGQPDGTTHAQRSSDLASSSSLGLGSDVRRVVGFVPQVDTMLRELTVRQVVTHSARTRTLPSKASTGKQHTRGASSAVDNSGAASLIASETAAASARSDLTVGSSGAGSVLGNDEIDTRVENVLRTLGISHVANTAVHALSASERKRTNIAIELAANPRALVLDEPTTGLDASSALTVGKTIRNLASTTGLTCLCIIHQPRKEIFHLLQDLIVLAPGGKLVYCGPAHAAVRYVEGTFGCEGFRAPPKVNPCDFLIDAVDGKYAAMMQKRSRACGGPNAIVGGAMADERVPVPAVDASTDKASVASFRRDEEGEEKHCDHVAADTLSRGAATSFPPVVSQTDGAASTALSLLGAVTLTPGLASAPQPRTPGNASGDASSGYQWPPDWQQAWAECGPAFIAGLQSTGAYGPQLRERAAAPPQTAGPDTMRGDAALEKAAVSPVEVDSKMKLAADRPGFILQTFLHFRRALLQHLSGTGLVVDLCSNFLGGVVMGIVTAGSSSLYQAPVPSVYAYSCPPGAETLCRIWLRNMVNVGSFYVAMTAGALAVPGAVRTFGREKEVYAREAATGIHSFAYFVGKAAADIPYTALTSFVLLAPLIAIGPWRAPPEELYFMLFCLQWFTVSLGYALSLFRPLGSPDAAALTGIVMCLLLNIFGGFVPKVGTKGVWAFTHWAQRGFGSVELLNGQGLDVATYNKSVPEEWEDPDWIFDAGMLLVFAVITQFLAYVLLYWGTRQDLKGK